MKPAALLRLASVIALRRIVSTWQLELAIAFGMVLAVALMVGGVIYSTFLEEAALQRNLKDQPLRELNLKLRTFYPLSREAHEDSLRFAEERVLNRMAPYSRGWSALVQTSTFYFVDQSSSAKQDNTRPRGKLQHMTGFTDRVQLVVGRFPQSGGAPLEVAFDDTGAALLNVSVGDVLTLAPAVATPNPR
ncbi:MAG: hypothetical protein Q8O40_01395, partial [Chloroflexota bacterium]|nr:hypothetical protein [Chloroflexota bacterium]